MSQKYKAFKVGPLPAAQINAALGLSLGDGDVWVSAQAHRHLAEDHPDDYPHIVAALATIVTGPLYAGQDPKHTKNFYLVRALSASAPNPFGLVAIGIQPNGYGGYNVRTAYTIPQATVDARRLANRLLRVI